MSAGPQRALRPLRVGEVLDTAIRLYARNAAAMWKIVAVVIVPLAIVQQAVVAASLPAGTVVRGGVLRTAGGSVSTPPGGFVAEVVLGLIGVLIVNGALALCLVDSHLGRPIDWRAALRAAVDRLGPLLWVAIIYGIGMFVGLVLFVVPGVWIGVMWAVAVPAVMVERIGGPQALGRSFALVRGRWWATFGALLVGLVILFGALLLVGLVLGAIESAVGVGSIGVWLVFGGLDSVIGDLIAYPFVGCVIAVIYVDLRVRKESLDLELLAGNLTSGPR